MSTPRQVAARRCHNKHGGFAKGKIPFRERFDESIVKSSTPDGCWLWKGAKTKKGYGLTSYNGHMCVASRATYLEFVGPLRRDQEACHSCDNPSCVNPAHLFAGTKMDNRLDSIRKGRYPHGESSALSKLTVAQVQAMRDLAVTGLSPRRIAEQFGMSRRQTHRIVTYRSWRRDARPN